MIPGSQARGRTFQSFLDPHYSVWPGRYINVRCCGGLLLAFLQLKDPLELFVKRRFFFLPVPGRCDIAYAVEGDVKPIPSSHRVECLTEQRG